MFREESSSSSSSHEPSRGFSKGRAIAAGLFGPPAGSASERSSRHDGSEKVHERPMRQMRPPPLSVLSLTSSARSSVLTKGIATELRSLLPPRLQLHDSWHCIYNLDEHGVSLGTLYAKCHDYRDKLGERPGFVIVVQDVHGSIFGAFVNEYFRPSNSYYGNGECFLYKIQALQQGGIRFKAYPWTGLNDYQIYCTSDFLSVGGGDGKYGIWLDDRLEKGLSSATLTFGNEALSDRAEDGRPFDVQTVEVWKI